MAIAKRIGFRQDATAAKRSSVSRAYGRAITAYSYASGYEKTTSTRAHRGNGAATRKSSAAAQAMTTFRMVIET